MIRIAHRLADSLFAQRGLGCPRPEISLRLRLDSNSPELWQQSGRVILERVGQLLDKRALILRPARQRAQGRGKFNEHVVVGVERAGL